MKLFVGLCALTLTVILSATSLFAQMTPDKNARWLCKPAGAGDTANATLKDGSVALVCKDIFVSVKTSKGKTMTLGSPTASTKMTHDLQAAQDAASAQAAADALAAALMSAGGGGDGGG
jgi:hypothetical protein